MTWMGPFKRFIPRDQAGWALLACRASGVLFTLQAVVLFALYSIRGFDTPPETMPPNLRIDPRHGVLHLAIGLVGGFVGFRRPDLSRLYVRCLALVYLALAFFGAFTQIHFGLQLAMEENLFHLTVGTVMAVIGWGPQVMRAGTRGAA